MKRIAFQAGICACALFLVAPAQAQAAGTEPVGTIDHNGRWIGELRFQVAQQKDVICKIAVALKSLQFSNSFQCSGLWWLPPGRDWTISGAVKPDGTLRGASIRWGYIDFATLRGNLVRANGEGGGQSASMVAASPGKVTIFMKLRLEGSDRNNLDGVYRLTETCAKSDIVESRWDVKLRLKLAVQGTSVNFGLFSTIYSNGTDHHMWRSVEKSIGRGGSVAIDTGAGTLKVNMSGPAPIATFNDKCDWTLKREATVSASSRDTSEFNGTYVFNETCPADDSGPTKVELVLLIKDTVAIGDSTTFYARGGIREWKSETLSFNANDPLIFEFGPGLGKFIVDANRSLSRHEFHGCRISCPQSPQRMQKDNDAIACGLRPLPTGK